MIILNTLISDLLQMMDLELEKATTPICLDDISLNTTDKENSAPNKSTDHGKFYSR